MKKTIARILLFCICTGCARAPAEAPTEHPTSLEHAQVIYYDISGSTASELRESMDKLRLRDPNDGYKAVDSFTAWFLVWYWLGQGTDWCNLSVVFVAYKVIVIMPRWDPPANASPELIDQWEKYIQSLTIHEKGHVDNIANNYLRVKTAIQNATCFTAEAEAQKVLDSLREFDSTYDSETNHGAMQGAVFY